MSRRASELALWIRQRVAAAGARGIVVGLSGGLNSAVVVRLCQMAVPGRVIGAVLPCHGDPQDDADAGAVADHFNLPVVHLDLGASYDQLTRDLAPMMAQVPGELRTAAGVPAVPLANIKPRLRMTALYFLANSLGYLVAGTGNRSDRMVGSFTKFGDGGVDLLPIGGLMKNDVVDLARDLELPPSIVVKAPGARLASGQTHEEEMGFSYADLEKYLTRGPDGVAPALVLRIERLVRSTEHKRTPIPQPDDDGS
jgi:NAD+ synthase